MKNILYVRLTTTRPKKETGFIRRTVSLFGNDKKEKPYTLSGIFDERLVRTGTLMEYYLKDDPDMDDIEKYHRDICDVMRNNNYQIVAFEDKNTAKNYEGTHLTGDKCVLGNEIGIIKNDMPDCINSFVGVILPDNIEEELLEVIADNFRYLIVYSHERDVRAKAAEHIMKYNSTAVITADKLYSLYDAKVIISVNTGTSRPPEGYPGKFIYAYPSFSGHDDRVCVNAYTENFTGIKLSAAYFEALRLND
ncbi:MAG: hypothetical protein IKM61_06235 [Eubacteriaceae bacterium]|nr:hypothetical protein [Eubacteriaceae bacterium]